MCEIQLSSAKEEFTLFKKHKEFQKFEVSNRKTGESTFVSLKEVEFNSRGSLFDQTLEYFIENRDKRHSRHQVEKLIKEKNTELKENLKSAKIFSKTASEETQDYKTKSFFGKVNYNHAPLFTPKELMTIELRIGQTESKSEATKLQTILNSADHSEAKNLSIFLGKFSKDNEPSKNAEQMQDKKQQANQAVHENKIENSILEKGR
jgi:hypothetical protein